MNDPARTPGAGAAARVPEELSRLTPPSVALFSDTMAPADPAVLESLALANSGGAMSYGGDDLTGRLAAAVRQEIADPEANVWPCWTGTGANMLATGLLSGVDVPSTDRPGADSSTGGVAPSSTDQARASLIIVCSDQAHVLRDEADGPQTITGAREPVTVPAREGVIALADLEATLSSLPDDGARRVLWLAQTTEDGRVQSLQHLTALIDAGHRHGCAVAIDGARIAHATAAGAHTLAEVWVAGPDAVVLGGSKVGMMGAELVLSRPGVDALWWRRSGQLPAKARYVAAQWLALFPHRWLELAGQANRRAGELAALLADEGLEPALPVEANTVFVDVGSVAAVDALNTWMPMISWDGTGLIRLACNPFTTESDIESVAAAVGAVSRRKA